MSPVIPNELCDSEFVDKLCSIHHGMEVALLFRRIRAVGFTLIALVALVGCGLNDPKVSTVIVTIPTNTLAPLVSMTAKFTATLPPTSTLIPSITPSPTNTLPPPPPTPSPAPTATPAIRGSVNFTSADGANLREGPGTRFRPIRTVKPGTPLIVLGINDGKDWYNVRLEDGGVEGWLSANLVTVADPSPVPLVTTADLTKRAQTPVGIAAVGTESGVPVGPTRVPGEKKPSDVLAYCDEKLPRGEPRKTFTVGTPVTIWWSWFAKQPEQLDDHVQQAEYEIKLDGQAIPNWRSFKTGVKKQGQDYYVYWYVPIGVPPVGEHKIEYKLTWKQQITDGYKKFGPGTDEESNEGSCVFTVK